MRPKRGRSGATSPNSSATRGSSKFRLAWKPILHGIILRTRPKKSAEAYNQIWTNEGSPLRVIAHRQAEALRTRLPKVSIHYAMRYGHPGIAAAIERMVDEGCTRILAAPLYPQYCAATTATANDALFACSPECAGSRRCGPCRLSRRPALHRSTHGNLSRQLALCL